MYWRRLKDEADAKLKTSMDALTAEHQKEMSKMSQASNGIECAATTVTQLIYVFTTTNAITRCILPMLSMTVQEIGGQKEARQKERLEEYEKQVVMQAIVDPSHLFHERC